MELITSVLMIPTVQALKYAVDDVREGVSPGRMVTTYPVLCYMDSYNTYNLLQELNLFLFAICLYSYYGTCAWLAELQDLIMNIIPLLTS